MSNMNGVIRVLGRDDRSYYTADDIMEIMGVRKSKAYSMIKALRTELIDAGKLTQIYPNGRIPKSYFNERCCV